MKNLAFAVASVGILAFTSCSNEVPEGCLDDGNVSFTVNLPEQMMSRAFSDGTTATEVKCYVYDQQNATGSVPMVKPVTMTGLTGTVSLDLVSGHTYDIVFLAIAGSESGITYDESARKMSVKYADSGIPVNSESLDAFYWTEHDFTVTGNVTKDIKLYRPFAQLNIGTSDISAYEAALATATISTTSVVVKNIYSSFDLMTEEVDGEATEVTFAPAALTTEAFPVEDETYDYLAMNYLLVPSTQDIVDVVMTVTNSDNSSDEREYNNIPVRRNYRTNIYGTLLTTPTAWNIEIKPGYNIPDNNIFISQEPKIDTATKTAEVSTYEQLAWFADNLNVNEIKNIKLTSDIDCGGQRIPTFNYWSPESPMNFDGDGHTISNFTVSKSSQYNGLFGAVTGTIKNLNMENITDEGIRTRFTGLVANLYGTMENVHAKNIHLKTADGRIGVLVGIHNSGKLINCSVSDCSVEGRWSIGGMVGAANETPGITYENCVVDNVTVKLNPYFGGVYDTMVGLMVGNINVGDVKFINCEIKNCDSDKPIYHSFNDYTWNGVVIPADISEEDGSPLTTGN